MLNTKNGEKMIREAVERYMDYSDQGQDIIDDISLEFIERLAKDAEQSKEPLRKIFRNHPCWDESRDCIVLNNEVEDNVDKIVAFDKLYDVFFSADGFRNGVSDSQKSCLADVLNLLNDKRLGIEIDINGGRMVDAMYSWELLDMGKFREDRKTTRVVRDIYQKLGLDMDDAFYRRLAAYADYTTKRYHGETIYVTVSPAHFLTMSNAKNEHKHFQSCHSLNSVEYEYNAGCSGYARDGVSFMVITCEDPNDFATTYSHKTSRQVFMYNPDGGVLVQSRMYNDFGDTETRRKIYREIVQKIIADGEGVPNYWVTKPMFGVNQNLRFPAAKGFLGYPDWQKPEFKAYVSVRKDKEDDPENFAIGTYGLCIKCGELTENGLYCHDCSDEAQYCEYCEGYHSPNVEFYTAMHGGREIHICEGCYEGSDFVWCQHCDTLHHIDDCVEVGGVLYCESCAESLFMKCDNCGEYISPDDAYAVERSGGYEDTYCESCFDDLTTTCDDCGKVVHNDDISVAFDSDGDEFYVCNSCLEDYEECPRCGAMHQESECPLCGYDEDNDIGKYRHDEPHTAEDYAEVA